MRCHHFLGVHRFRESVHVCSVQKESNILYRWKGMVAISLYHVPLTFLVFYIWTFMSSISRPRVYILKESYHTKLYIFHKIIVKISQVCLFSRWYFRGDFFLKIGIQRDKVYTKNVPNIEAYDFIPSPFRILSIKQVIVVLY